MLPFPALCLSCIRRDPSTEFFRYPNTPKCQAFTKGIPVGIYWHGEDHRQPIEGDLGITYKEDASRLDLFEQWRQGREEIQDNS